MPSSSRNIRRDEIDYFKLILSDSNLPTGGFVASSGLESYVAHSQLKDNDIKPFLRFSVDNNARQTLSFIRDVYNASNYEDYDEVISNLIEIDKIHEAQMLNAVNKRASKAQGVAFLTLYTKSFGEDKLIKDFKMKVRKGLSPGHLAISWALITSLLGIPLDESQHLYLFLQARSVLSAGVRLNILGPYAAQKVLMYDVKSIVDDAFDRERNVGCNFDNNEDTEDDDDIGPATTWPLIELLNSRHDLLHTRIFNS